MEIRHQMPLSTLNNRIHTLIASYEKADEFEYHTITAIDNYLRKN